MFFTVGYLTALGVFNVVATAAGARLLFGMGRDELLPRAVFARVNRRWRTPHWSILLICAIEFALGNFANMETLSNLVNYGAMFAFAALNISVVWLYYVRGGGELADGSPPASRRLRTCATCRPPGWPSSSTWAHMDTLAQILGTVWLAAGIAYLLAKTRVFQRLPPALDL